MDGMETMVRRVRVCVCTSVHVGCGMAAEQEQPRADEHSVGVGHERLGCRPRGFTQHHKSRFSEPGRFNCWAIRLPATIHWYCRYCGLLPQQQHAPRNPFAKLLPPAHQPLHIGRGRARKRDMLAWLRSSPPHCLARANSLLLLLLLQWPTLTRYARQPSCFLLLLLHSWAA